MNTKLQKQYNADAGARRVVLLGRVSRGERQQDPQNQLAPLRAMMKRLGWPVVAVVSLKMSAWDAAAAAEVRRQALAPIKAGHADTLACWSWDRYSREGIEGAFRELRYLEHHLGAWFYSLQEPFLSTATADAELRGLLLSFTAWQAQRESQRKSERVKAKVATKRGRAGRLGERARWGVGRLASPDEMNRVRALWRSGESVRAIVADLDGQISKSQVGRLVKGVKRK